MILLDVSGASAVVRKQDILTSGMVGEKVVFSFDTDWDGLTKTAVFRAGRTTKDAVITNDIAVIPHEVLTIPGIPLEIGVYGTANGGKIVIPTVWAKTRSIKRGADPSGDESTDPTLPIWAQIQEQSNTQNAALQNKITRQLDNTEENIFLERVSNGHFYRLPVDAAHMMDMWIVNADGEIEKGSDTTDPVMPPRAGSDFIKCPRYLCLDFSNTDLTFFMYFYSLESGEYVPRWDIISRTTSSRKKNYIDHTYIYRNYGNVIEIPEGEDVYMQVGSFSGGTVNFYGWDGEPFGMPLSADYCYPTYSSGAGAFAGDGRYAITIPGSAKYILAKSEAAITNINGYKGSEETPVHNPTRNTSTPVHVKYFKLPEGYDCFRARIPAVTDEAGVHKSRAGDVSDVISVVVSAESEKPSGMALKIIENAKKISGIKWTAQANLTVSGSNIHAFKKGVEYTGIPYGSNWDTAHYIGWHVSPHTFVNAANDADSIFYKETVIADNEYETESPYYSTVCSAFTSLCAGWSYPEMNAGYAYDPNVFMHYVAKPPIGMPLVNSERSHVVIPERIDQLENDVAISAYEATSPASQRTTRYKSINSETPIGPFKLSSGATRYTSYGCVVHNVLSNPDLSLVPYIDLDDVEIVNGSARPYKGDKSVYTSADEKVLINIKDANATYMYLSGGDVGDFLAQIDIAKYKEADTDATRVDVKPFINNADGIFYVWTDTNAKRESFEFRTVETITYTLENKKTNAFGRTGGTPKLSTTDFMYAIFMMNGNPRLGDKSKGTSQPPAEDYSYLTANGAICTSVYAIFRKGTYGAYTVPFEKIETE